MKNSFLIFTILFLIACGSDLDKDLNINRYSVDSREATSSDLKKSKLFKNYLEFVVENYHFGYPKKQLSFIENNLDLEESSLLSLESKSTLDSLHELSEEKYEELKQLKSPIYARLNELKNNNELNVDNYDDFKDLVDRTLLENNIDKEKDDLLRKLKKEFIFHLKKERETFVIPILLEYPNIPEIELYKLLYEELNWL